MNTTTLYTLKMKKQNAMVPIEGDYSDIANMTSEEIANQTKQALKQAFSEACDGDQIEKDMIEML